MNQLNLASWIIGLLSGNQQLTSTERIILNKCQEFLRNSTNENTGNRSNLLLDHLNADHTNIS